MVNRISGLATGFDVDGTVAKLMKAARMPLDKLTQNKQWLQWQTDDYRAINSKILDLRNNVFNLKLQASFQSKKAASSVDTIASATATANATEGVYSLNVTNLAAAATLTSSGPLGGDTSKTLGDPAGINLTADTTLTIGGQTGTATINVKKTDTIAQFLANVNGKSSVTGVKLSYDSTLDRLFFVSSTTGAATKVDLKTQTPSFLGDTNGTIGLKLAGITTSVTTGQTVVSSRVFASGTELVDSTLTGSQTKTLRITYNGNNYDDVITGSKSISQVIDEINGSAFGKTGVSAYLDSTGRLAFFNPDGTKALGFQDVTVPAPATTIVTAMGLGTPTTTSGLSYSTVNTSAGYKAANISTKSVAGVDANITFNSVSGTYASNTFTVAGINLTLKTTGATNITVTRDVDSTFNSIKAFIDKYNETIDSVSTKMVEMKNRDYLPLTDAQKVNMKDTDITNWQNKAKSGTLHNDSILSTALSTFRDGLSKAVTGIPSGNLTQLFQIGITTGTYQGGGKLYIDEAKLKSAIAANPDQVQKLFTADDGVTATNDGQGLAVRMYNLTQSVMTQLNSKAGMTNSINANFLIGRQMNDIDKKVTSMNRKINDLEARYYRQFSAMEQAINKLNAQSLSFQSAMGK